MQEVRILINFKQIIMLLHAIKKKHSEQIQTFVVICLNYFTFLLYLGEYQAEKFHNRILKMITIVFNILLWNIHVYNNRSKQEQTSISSLILKWIWCKYVYFLQLKKEVNSMRNWQQLCIRRLELIFHHY